MFICDDKMKSSHNVPQADLRFLLGALFAVTVPVASVLSFPGF